MKNLCSLILFLVFELTATAQSQWTWVGGDKERNIKGNYGSQGVASPSNLPGSRIGAATWNDKQGNLWLFGGLGKGEDSHTGLLNDLWKYNPASNRWTWVGGRTKIETTGKYGDKGKPSEKNEPGSRQNAVFWTDNNGNFWLFGGFGIAAKQKGRDSDDDDERGSGNNEGGNKGFLNDLWKYSPSTGQWTWINGTDETDENGRYGDFNQPSSSNYPGGRYMATGWIDAIGNLYLFGGRGHSSTTGTTNLNDVWKYSPSANTWTWVRGSKNGGADGSYGQKGVFSRENSPGARHGSTGWRDKQGKFWLFGGTDRSGLFSDLWKFDPQSNQWAWIGGSRERDIFPIFESIGVPSKNANPGARMLASPFTDADGNLWLFGGEGYGGMIGKHPLNNLWQYSISANQWTFVKGQSSILPDAVYGTKGTAARGNTPGGVSNGAAWTDTQGNFWVFGGQSQGGFLNQLWKHGKAAAAAPPCEGSEPTGTISPATSTVCEGISQALTATGGSSYTWFRDGVEINGEHNASLIVTQAGTYSVIIKKDGCTGEASNTAIVTESEKGIRYPDVVAQPNVSVQLSAREIGVAYLWSPFTGLDDPTSVTTRATIAANSEYTVRITTEKRCVVTDTVLVRVSPVAGEEKKIFVPTAFTPNGNGVNDVLRPLGNITDLDYFRVYNRWGQLLFNTNQVGVGWDGTFNGTLQPTDTYTWILQGKGSNGEIVKMSGKALLIR
jgi:gliding motility-associated-like protein